MCRVLPDGNHLELRQVRQQRPAPQPAQRDWRRISHRDGGNGELKEQKRMHQQVMQRQKGGDFAGSWAVAQQGLQRWPSNHYFLMSAAGLAKRQGNHTAACEYYERALADRPWCAKLIQGLAGITPDLAAARQLFQSGLLAAESLRHGPHRTEALVRLKQGFASFELKRGDRQTAMDLLQSALKLRPTDLHTLHILGTQALQDGQLDAARQRFQQCVAIDPHSMHSWQALGLLEFRSAGNVERAREIFQRGADLGGGHMAPLLAAWAGMEGSLGRTGLARQLYEQALAASPRHVMSTLGLARMEERRSNFTAAVALYERALRQSSRGTQHVIMHAYAAMQINCGHYNEARKLLQRLLTDRPEDSTAWAILGTLQQKEGDTAGAMHSFQEGVLAATGPWNGLLNCHLSLAVMRETQGDLAGAEQLYREAEARCGGRMKTAALLTYLVAYAAFCKRRGRLEEAAQVFERAITHSPASQQVWLQYGQLETRRGQLDAARGVYKRAIAARPLGKAHFAYQLLGRLEASVGRTQQAREIFAEGVAATHYPAPELLSEWALLEARQGEVDVARGIFEKGLQAWLSGGRPIPLKAGMPAEVDPVIPQPVGIWDMHEGSVVWESWARAAAGRTLEMWEEVERVYGEETLQRQIGRVRQSLGAAAPTEEEDGREADVPGEKSHDLPDLPDMDMDLEEA